MLSLVSTAAYAQEDQADPQSVPETVADGARVGGARALEEFEPDYVHVPGLREMYGVQFDRNNPLKIDTRFVFEQIIDPDTGLYRTDSIFKNEATGLVPNWFLYLRMENCYYCDQLRPNVGRLAREFHKPDSKFNYIVAELDCGTEEGVFMCQYMHVNRLPRFIVFRPESLNSFF